ncbi:tripartite tricarboxylate transporter substrate binding protein [Bordetella sp. BOR01]|uniref:tripartite tricarboxylate transporter substrate binding protein n=1 Tax=Bordetella sp. BOR01 TaxID=2854779 RepID=UPI001C458994|nr:tripartite tricarboxylate transporter substrate binding protein [Bordetella sp. BOR01]MBV7486367.1 tripartite tricarboxylate transporter substrate binding protein [Bordetella sp. BOR01]
MKTLIHAAAGLVLSLMIGSASAQYPDKPLRLIVPFSPGGTTDAVARVMAQYLGQLIDQPVAVENKGGGSTIIGTEALARAAPDGYTLMLATPDFTVNPSLRAKLPYDTLKDFTPIALIGTYPMLLVTRVGGGLDSTRALLDQAKAHPKRLSFASAGNGSMPHLCAELLMSLAHVDLMHVPFKGNGPALTDLVAGRVSMLFSGAPAVDGLVQSGKLQVLAVTSKTRHPSLPDVPTLAESGVPGYEVIAWFGVLAPAGVPADVVQRLNTAIGAVMAMPEVREKLSSLGADLRASTPAEFDSQIRSEIDKWGRVVKTAGIEAY